MTSEHAGGKCADVGGADRNLLIRHANLLDPALLFPHPHSIVPGGTDNMREFSRMQGIRVENWV
jgi:hypothetical protein